MRLLSPSLVGLLDRGFICILLKLWIVDTVPPFQTQRVRYN